MTLDDGGATAGALALPLSLVADDERSDTVVCAVLADVRLRVLDAAERPLESDPSSSSSSSPPPPLRPSDARRRLAASRGSSSSRALVRRGGVVPFQPFCRASSRRTSPSSSIWIAVGRRRTSRRVDEVEVPSAPVRRRRGLPRSSLSESLESVDDDERVTCSLVGRAV